MAYNLLTGTVIAADKYLPGELTVNIVSGNLSTSDGASVINSSDICKSVIAIIALFYRVSHTTLFLRTNQEVA